MPLVVFAGRYARLSDRCAATIGQQVALIRLQGSNRLPTTIVLSTSPKRVRAPRIVAVARQPLEQGSGRT